MAEKINKEFYDNLSETEKELCNNINFFDKVCINHPRRLSRKNKKAFMKDMIEIAYQMGYKTTIECGTLAKNVVFTCWENETEKEQMEWKNRQQKKVDKIFELNNLKDKAKNFPQNITKKINELLSEEYREVSKDRNEEFVIGAHYDTPPALFKSAVKHPYLVMGAAYCLALTGGIYGANCIAAKMLSPENFYFANQVIYDASICSNLGVQAYVLGLFGEKTSNTVNYLDNSSGVMAVLQLMYLYKDAPKDVKEKIKLVLFDNEEKLLLGSFSYAEKHKTALKNQSVINMDCIGEGKDILLLHGNWFKGAPKLASELYTVFKEKSKLNPFVKPSTMTTMSDHLSFLGAKETLCLLSNDLDTYSLGDYIHTKNDREINPATFNSIVNSVYTVMNNRINNKVQMPEYQSATMKEFCKDLINNNLSAFKTVFDKKFKIKKTFSSKELPIKSNKPSISQIDDMEMNQ